VADHLDRQAALIDPTVASQLATAPPPVAAHAVRRWWREETGVDHPPGSAAVERVLDVAGGRAVRCELPGGWRVSRTAGRLRLEGPRSQPGNVTPR